MSFVPVSICSFRPTLFQFHTVGISTILYWAGVLISQELVQTSFLGCLTWASRLPLCRVLLPFTTLRWVWPILNQTMEIRENKFLYVATNSIISSNNRGNFKSCSIYNSGNCNGSISSNRSASFSRRDDISSISVSTSSNKIVRAVVITAF